MTYLDVETTSAWHSALCRQGGDFCLVCLLHTAFWSLSGLPSASAEYLPNRSPYTARGGGSRRVTMRTLQAVAPPQNLRTGSQEVANLNEISIYRHLSIYTDLAVISQLASWHRHGPLSNLGTVIWRCVVLRAWYYVLNTTSLPNGALTHHSSISHTQWVWRRMVKVNSCP